MASHPPEKKEDAAATATAGAAPGDLEDPQFQCCVCLELLYKPVVIACGHMSCFWCVHKAMHVYHKSYCAICRQPYRHFPSICQLLHHLLLKLEPVEYKIREQETLEDEKRENTFSPQTIEFLSSTNNKRGNGEYGAETPEDNDTEPLNEISTDGDIITKRSRKIKLEDVSCHLCKELLYEPAVLNCGHVFCMSCLSLDGEALKCHVCGSLHPGDFPNICLDLNHFIEEYFPEEYQLRRDKVDLKNNQCNIKGSSSGTSCTKESGSKPSKISTCLQHDEDFSNVHIGVGCDSCGVYPIKGKRYKCKDCTEVVGFDLCEECYTTKSKLPGRFNQQHTPDHKMVLDDTALLERIIILRGMPEEGAQGTVGAYIAAHVLDDSDEEDQLA